MGYAYYDLIPAAILLDNPNITREEFARRLKGIGFSSFREFSKYAKWNSCSKKYNGSLNELARLIRLNDSEKFKEFRKEKKDENNLTIFPPRYEYFRKRKRFEVSVHKQNVLEQEKEIENFSWEKAEEGTTWTDYYGTETGLVKSIVHEEKLFEGEEDEGNEDYLTENPRYKYKMIIIPIHQKWEHQSFPSEEELFKKWPQFHTDFVHNWSQTGGYFAVLFSGESFKWRQKNGLYSLDPITFDLIPDGITTNSHEWGYRDLILTAEAIKQRAWKLMSYRGLNHLEAFLKKFPDSLKRYEGVVYDSYTSSFAKSHNMTITEFLLWRRDLRLGPPNNTFT